MSKKNRKANNAPRAIRRGRYVHHIANNAKRRGCYFHCEAGGRVARIVFAQPAESEYRRAA